jgi:hypothetical protein
MPGKIIAYANCDHVIVAWHYDAPIDNCVGFALYKAANGESPDTAEPLPNRIGFAGQSPQPGEQRPSTEWPIQRFLWTDYDVKPGDTVSYMVVPMLINGTDVAKDLGNKTTWTPVTLVGTDVVTTGTGFQAYFNRGIISSQFMSRQLATLKATDKTATLDTTLKDPDSVIRQFLGGVLAVQLFDELDAVVNDTSITLYASLYELNEVNVLAKFKDIGKRLNLILANGAFSSKKPDENEDARNDLKTNSEVNVFDRLVKGKHFAHNKFIVFCKDGVPYKVWTGSTNLTENGLYTQVNNAVIITDPNVAAWYLAEWKQIQAAGSDYPADYISYNSNGNATSSNMTTWFAPVDHLQDMNAANTYINAAQQGILFLMFNPGPNGTLYDTILDMIGSSPNLFVHGIMNQNPFGKVHPLVFIDKGETQETSFDAILPGNIGDEFAYWAGEIHSKMVTIHSKVIIIDPFGANPVVMTGSHNMGPKASAENDDNLNIILNNPSLARQYAVNILSVYDHFRWRYSLAQKAGGTQKAGSAPNVYQGLSTDPGWMKNYSTDANIKELQFLGL